jgi:hypothetical protein
MTGILAAAAFALRTAGLALFAAWALAALLRREWRSFALRAGLGAACALAWQAHVARVQGAPEYAAPAYAYQRAPYQFYNVSYAENVALLDPFRPEAGALTPADLPLRLVRNACYLWIGLGESVSAPRGFFEWPLRVLGRSLGAPLAPSLAWAAPILLGLLVVAGLVLLARSGQGLLVLYVLGSAALIALLPWPVQVPRYLAPLAPFLALALTEALVRMARVRPRLAGALCAALACVQAFAAVQSFTLFRRPVPLPGAEPARAEQELFLFEEAREWRAFYAGLEWLRTSTPTEARVASTCPHLVWLHTGRQAVLPPFEPDVREAQRLLDTVPVDYLLVDTLRFVDVGPRYVEPVVRELPERWQRVHATDDGRLLIYRRVH